jgi:hypothetical protein
MDPQTLWYGLALLIGLIAPWLLVSYECRRLGLDLPVGKRVSGAVFWGVIYTIVSFAFCIDIARLPVSEGWGLAILATSMSSSAFWTWALSYGRPVWVRQGEE